MVWTLFTNLQHFKQFLNLQEKIIIKSNVVFDFEQTEDLIQPV